MRDRPLDGWRIVVTRPRAQADAFSSQLEALGARVITFPTIAIEPPADTRPLDQAITNVGSYDWIIFTSVNGVEHFWGRAETTKADLAPIHKCRVAVIGPATAAALLARGIEPDVIPTEFVAEAIVDTLPEVAGLHILLPRADIARAVLREQLVARGAHIDEVAAYRTVPGQPSPEAYDALRSGIDLITFTSASTVRYFVELVGDLRETVLREAAVACIGPITARAAREHDLAVHIVAEEYTVDGLTQAILAGRGKTLVGVGR